MSISTGTALCHSGHLMKHVKLYICQWHNYSYFWQPHNDHIWHLQSKKKMFWKAPAVSFHRESYSKLGILSWHSLGTLWQQLISWDRRREAEHGGYQNARKLLWAVLIMPITQSCLFLDYFSGLETTRHIERGAELRMNWIQHGILCHMVIGSVM